MAIRERPLAVGQTETAALGIGERKQTIDRIGPNFEVVSGRERRVYTLTDKGREAFRVAVEAWMDVTRCLLDTERVVADGAACGGGKGCC